MNFLKPFLVMACATVLPPPAHAQTIDMSVIRTAGAICGAGLSLDAQGKLDADILRLFGGVSAEGNTQLDVGRASELLEMFGEEQRGSAYETYVRCILQTVNSVAGVARQADPGDTGQVIIESGLLPDPLAVMKNGDRFQMGIGDARAIERDSLLFSFYVAGTLSNNQKYIDGTVTDLLDNSTATVRIVQAAPQQIGASCALTPYSIDVTEKLASFLVRCN